MNFNNGEELNRFVDLVSQAVLDKMEEQRQVSMVSELVVRRVMELMAQEKALEVTDQDGFEVKSKEEDVIHVAE